MKKRGGIYVHVPVCRRKCLYCSFYSVGERLFGDWYRYVSDVLKELESREKEIEGWKSVTIYIGGGTPSLMPADEFCRMMRGLRHILYKVNPEIEISEVTIEVNPDDVTEEAARSWKEAGVNRVSMGVQSLLDSELKAIGRRHDAKTAKEAYEILAKYFDNISLDLIFGIPGQTLESLQTTLEGLISMGPKHISAYSLMYEERSALTRLLKAGKIEETDEDITVGMFALVNEILGRAGFDRYEISNYALPGYESRHNSSYWHGLPYVGLGPAAHSFDGARIRRWNDADIKRYLEGVEKDGKYYDFEILEDYELIEERIMTELRTSAGLSLADFVRDFGVEAKDKLMVKAGPAKEAGNLEEKDNFLRLTDKGVMISDEIIVQLF